MVTRDLLFSTALWSNYNEGLFVGGMEPGLERVPVPLQVWRDDHWRRPSTTTREIRQSQIIWQLWAGMEYRSQYTTLCRSSADEHNM